MSDSPDLQKGDKFNRDSQIKSLDHRLSKGIITQETYDREKAYIEKAFEVGETQAQHCFYKTFGE